MNVILNPIQSNTKEDDITLVANSNLTGKEGYLWKLVGQTATPTVPAFDLPAAILDEAYYVGASGDIAGNPVAAESPSLGENCRIACSGTFNPGTLLALNPSAWGQLYVPTSGAGSGCYDWIAEEAGMGATTGTPQFILVRRIGTRLFSL